MNPTPDLPTMTDDLLNVDAANREAALDPWQSFLIEAPAGAGKTELLTQRFLALLATVDDPEEIIALTFTNKAAAEMRHRVVSSLKLSATGVAPAEPHRIKTFDLGRKVLERDADKQWHLLDHAGRLQITTLDALCGKLARQMPLLSRMGSQPGITTDSDVHYAQAALATLQSIEDETSTAQAIARVLDYLENNTGRFQTLVMAMLASRDQWLRHSRAGIDLDAAENALRTLISLALQDIAKVLPDDVQTALMPIARFAADNALTAQASGESLAELTAVTVLADWVDTLSAAPQDLPKWRGLTELLLTKGGSPRSNLPPVLGLSAGQGKELGKALKSLIETLVDKEVATLLKQVRTLPSPVYEEPEKQLIEDLLVVLKVAFANLWQSFKSAGEVDFTEMAQNALLALGDEGGPSDLQLKLDYRISHLLVDEFQDTSPTQVELLRQLTAQWTPEEGRTLFLVGDPMQSIYRFRKADVGLFLRVKQNGLGNIPLTDLKLYRNNRSHEEIVNWGNQVFPSVFADADDFYRGAVQFAPAKATKGSHPQAGVTWHPIIDTNSKSTDADDEDDALDPASEREAQAVIDIVRQAQAEDPQGSIAVLVRARTHLTALVKALQALPTALPFQAVEIEGLADRQVVQDLLSLTHALLHRGDRTHWLAVLRAPWCGLLLEDLHRLVADDHASTVWSLMSQMTRCAELSVDGQARLTHVRDVLTESFVHQGRPRLRRWIEGTWQNLGGPHCLAESGDLGDAQAFFDVLDRLDEQASVDLSRLTVEVGKLYAAPDPNASPQLQIMTVHKSKGLEFDTVILPSLHRKAPPTDKKLMLWDEVLGADGRENLVVAPLPFGLESETNEPSKFSLLYQFEGVRSRNETQRLLYVAVTRTKRHLHLLGNTKVDAKGDGDALKPPAKGSLLELLWRVAQSEFDIAYQRLVEQQRLSSPIDTGTDRLLPENFNHRLVRLNTPQRTLPLTHRERMLQETANLPPVDFEDKEETDGNGQWAADIGTLVHRYLEIIARDGLSGWSSERVRELSTPMQRWLRQQGHPLAKAQSAADKVIHHLVNTLASEQGRWILGEHDDAGCEVAYTSFADGEVRNHIIDRTFVADGVRWIVDYKTTTMEVTSEQLDSYQAQLTRYRELFGGDRQIRCGIWLTETAQLVDV
jgi:ATP-dependent helicase/nuclease subunit A